MDIFSTELRSKVMASVKAQNTVPERQVRRALWAAGFRYARSYKGLAGKPDVILPAHNTVIFVHGCFWHGHECDQGTLPKTNNAYWVTKVERTRARDQRTNRKLRKLGWHCYQIRTCSFDRDLARIIATLRRL